MSLGSRLLKKADSYAYRRGTHTDKNQAFRLAGKILQMQILELKRKEK